MSWKNGSDDFSEDEVAMLEMLASNGQLLETDDENVQLPPGITHILLRKQGEKPRLIRKRFSR